MGLEPDDAVDHVDAGVLELAGPADVGLLVEAGLDLDDGEHLLAGLGRVDEGVDDRAVAAGAVEGLLDRQHPGVGRGLLDERLHRGRERVVGVVQQDVRARIDGEDVAGVGGLDGREVRVRLRDERREAQLGAVEVGDEVEPGQVQRRRQAVDLALVDAELADQQVEHVVVHVLGDLEAHRRPEPAPGQLLLQRGEEVLGVVLLDLEVLVAGDPEREVLAHLHAGEELVQVRGDDVLERHEARVVQVGVAESAAWSVTRMQPGQQRRHLDPGEVLVAGLGVDQHDGEVEREAGDVGERVRRVHGQRRQHREHLLAEHPVQRLLLPSAARPTGRWRCPPRLSAGRTSSSKTAACMAISSWATRVICSSTSRGSSPEAERTARPVAMRRLSPATRTMKNSSRLLAKMAR